MAGKGRIFVLLALVLVILAAAYGLRVRGYLGVPPKLDEASYLAMFRDTLSLVKKNYVEKPDEKKLMESAINGMLSSLDPHSAYLPPEPFKEMNVMISGSFGGLGIELSIKNDKLTVISPIQDTPAFRAGIRSNDHIFKIDEKPTKGMRIEQAVKLMRGKEGTPVTLTIVREGSPKPLVFPLVRAIIRVTSLKYRILEPGYGYVGISQFQERTAEDFDKALKKLKEQNKGPLKGLVIDVRFNPGGLVDSAVRVADRFVGEDLKKDGTIVAIKGREASATKIHYATVGEKEPPYPIVVLINGGSASASEILAGALQDHKRAVVMGTQSFGKGSVQSVVPMKGGAGLKLTIARYYTPSGRSIQAKGITPDIIVNRVDLDGVRKQTDKPFHEKDLENHISPEKKASEGKSPAEEKIVSPVMEKKGVTEPGKPDETAEGAGKDYQLSRALELLKGMNVLQNLTQRESK